MKKATFILLGLLIFPISLLAYVSPGKPTGYTNDFANVLSAQEKQEIEQKLLTVNRGSGFEIAVVTVASIGDETVETYAEKLFQEWGIGNEKIDTGLLLLVAITERSVRIETGYGAEGAVTDIQAGNIIRSVITPAFQQGNYGAGISGAVDALNAIITGSPEAAQYSIEQSGTGNPFSGWDIDPFALVFFALFILNVFAKILGKTKSWWLGGVIGAFIGTIIGFIWGFISIGIISIIVLTILGLVFDFIVSKRPPGSDGHGGFWPIFFGGGHGGSSGGFGGFGGGMSGGGGASGRW